MYHFTAIIGNAYRTEKMIKTNPFSLFRSVNCNIPMSLFLVTPFNGQIRPVVYNYASPTIIKVATEIKVEVVPRCNNPALSVHNSVSPLFMPIYRNTILNFEESRLGTHS